MRPTARIAWKQGLPEGSNVYTAYTSVKPDGTTDGGAGQLLGAAVCWFVAAIWNSQAGTLRGYFSNDNGVTWRLIKSVAMSAASTAANLAEFYIEPYEHVKFEWTNGGVTQTIFDANFALSPHRDPALPVS